ncbi:MAG: HD domain-containing protein [Polyangiaceae bacterium]
MAQVLSRSALLAAIEADSLLQRVFAHAQRVCAGDPAHDIEHLLRVARWTIAIQGEAAELRECACAALLHDIVNLPKNHPDRARASALSGQAARELIALDLSPDAIERVVQAIEDHSFSAGRRPRSPLGEALQDADRLEALGALGIARTFSTGVRLGADYFDPFDPWSERRELDDLRFSVDHFSRSSCGCQRRCARSAVAPRHRSARASWSRFCARWPTKLAFRCRPSARGPASSARNLRAECWRTNCGVERRRRPY